MGLLDQGIQILECAKNGIDITIVANVVAKVGHRRGVDGGEPENVNPKPAQIVESADNTRQIANPVPVAIHKTSWIYLVDYTRLPPRWLHVFSSICIMLSSIKSKLPFMFSL